MKKANTTDCNICMENPINSAISPCGHSVCCDTCAKKLQTCPMCRGRIGHVLKIYNA